MLAKEILKQFFTGTPQGYRSPGRVNIIGEHTDYNFGWVLPMAIDFATEVWVEKRTDQKLCIYSEVLAKSAELDINASYVGEKGDWLNYIVGMVALLKQAGYVFGGANVYISSTVPLGAGLSSSASLEIGLGYALLDLHGYAIDKLKLAQIAQQAEHQFVGTSCGLMDQLICSFAQQDHALLIDCEQLQFETVPFRLGSASLLILDTGVRHQLAGSAYNQRRAECELGAKLLGLKNLRALELDQLLQAEAALPELVFKRCRHVLTENARVLASVEAMEKQDSSALGRLLLASHRSLQHDYQVTCSELDFLVDAAMTLPSVYGARMTGGGFGGCVIALVRTEQQAVIRQKLANAYAKAFGRELSVFQSKAGIGVSRIR